MFSLHEKLKTGEMVGLKITIWQLCFMLACTLVGILSLSPPPPYSAFQLVAQSDWSTSVELGRINISFDQCCLYLYNVYMTKIHCSSELEKLGEIARMRTLQVATIPG